MRHFSMGPEEPEELHIKEVWKKKKKSGFGQSFRNTDLSSQTKEVSHLGTDFVFKRFSPPQ